MSQAHFRTSPPEVFLGKAFLKMCSRFTGEHPCRSAPLLKWLYWNHTLTWVFPQHPPQRIFSLLEEDHFFKIDLGTRLVFPVNLLHVYRIPFPKNTSGRLLLTFLLFTLSGTYKDEYQGNKMRYADFLTLLSCEHNLRYCRYELK